jgi:Zinc dependent phospholipase C
MLLKRNPIFSSVRTTLIRSACALTILTLLAAPHDSHAYSVLSHEAVVDLAWKDQIVPLLLSRFPKTTPEGLVEAHAYAYGGCILQDIGYYPFGSHFFSDLLHYVRTGDFVANLLDEASDVNEYAFALGALAHYAADTYGHPAVNRATATEYPKLRGKFGNQVTYDQDPVAHLRTEFGFDIVEVVHNRYAPEAYHSFIGFEVSKPAFERAFRETYGFEVNQILTHEDLAIGTYRKTVSSLLPKMTEVAVQEFSKQVDKDNPSFDAQKLRYRISRTEYEKNWGTTYKKPSIGSRTTSFFIGILPKVGPLKALALRMPSADSQQVFLESMNNTVDHYNQFLVQLRKQPPYRAALDLPDRNLDTGKLTAPGEYKLADYTYSKLLATIVKNPDTPIPGDLRDKILAFYASNSKNYVAQNPDEWRRTEEDLSLLRNAKLNVLKVSDQPTATQQPAISAK